jgi:dTDP-4-amino-4,6-dideoxygalactose transaminase
MNKRIYLSSPHMGGNELRFIQEAFNENWIAPLGPNVNGLEQDIQNYTGVAHAAALSSGTAALHLALILLNVGREDEVICSSFTFSASANPIVYQGAIPVFVDSEADTWNMDPNLLRDAIKDGIRRGKKPKAVILVHLYGTPAKMDEIVSICAEYEVPLIEDAAEALGARYKGKMCGAFGVVGILSFNGNKIITTSGGGSLISNDSSLIEKSRFLATQARDPAPYYQHSQIGYNYRMSNISAGIGRGQMEVIDERVNQRRTNFEYYRSVLGEHEAFSFLEEPEHCFSNRWLTCVLFNEGKSGGKSPEAVRQTLEKDNIESRPLWKPMHLQPVFSGCRYFGGDLSEKLFNRGLCLPSGSNLSKEDLELVTGKILASL